MGERRYTEKEMVAILRSASTAQAKNPELGDNEGGFTLSEIERLASEVGIDPRQIAKAAEGLPFQDAGSRRYHFFGAPTQETVERTYTGSLSDDSWDDLVEELRMAYASNGEIHCSGNTREWTGGSDTISAHLSAVSRDGHTKFRLSVRRQGGVLLAWCLASAVMFVLSLILVISMHKAGADWFATLLGFVPMNALLYALASMGVGTWGRNHMTQAHTLLNHCQRLTSTPSSTANPVESPVMESLEQRLRGSV